MNIALFGGTFDPIHNGHLQAALVAARKFKLDRVLFVPAGNPPHKRNHRLAPYEHRFAMVSLACAGDKAFVPSLLEAPRGGKVQYSVDTARSARRALRARDRLFFLIGFDVFCDLWQWKQPERLLALVEFIVVSRRGFRMDDLAASLPPRLSRASRREHESTGARPFRMNRLHMLDGVDVPVSSSGIRQALRHGLPVTGLIPPLVEEYILKTGFYKSAARKGLQL